MPSSLLADVQQHAAQMGLNLFGVVDAARFDACQPKDQRARTLQPTCGTVVVLGTGGRDFWRHFAAASPAAAAATAGACQPEVQQFAGRLARDVAARLAAHRLRSRLVESTGRCGLNFARLGEAAGFGTVSPVSGLLLHPEYGPWVSLHAALLVEGHPFGPIPDASITDRFQPCCACHKPCVSACPVSVHDGHGNHDLLRCAGHRHAGNCGSGCSSRSACPIGAEHRDGTGEHSHRHTYTLPHLQRWFGLGVWRFVPRFLRR